jgi:hypothetical protein
MSKLNLSRYLSTRELHYDKATLTFSEEASTCRFPGPYRLYDDAADEGVWVKSHKTGETLPFMLIEHDKDREGDTRFWRFRCWRDSTTPVLYLTIFND